MNGISTGNPEDLKKLTEEIYRRANDEAEKILREANEQALESGGRAFAEAGELEERIKQEAALKRQKMLSAVEYQIKILQKRALLKFREQLSEKIIREAVKRLEALSFKPEYRKIFAGWTVEACIGLNEKKAVLSASEDELKLADKKFVEEVTKRVKANSGLDIELSVSSDPQFQKGPLVKSLVSRTAYSNQLLTRLERYKSEIRTLIQKSLFN